MKGLHFYADKTSNLKNEALKSFRPGTARSLKSFVLAVCVAAVAAVGAFAAEMPVVYSVPGLRNVRDLGLTDAEIAAIRFNLTNGKKGEVK